MWPISFESLPLRWTASQGAARCEGRGGVKAMFGKARFPAGQCSPPTPTPRPLPDAACDLLLSQASQSAVVWNCDALSVCTHGVLSVGPTAGWTLSALFLFVINDCCGTESEPWPSVQPVTLRSPQGRCTEGSQYPTGKSCGLDGIKEATWLSDLTLGLTLLWAVPL